MDIVGTGFLAGNLRRIAGKHSETVALAAGVSWAAGTAVADFAREAALLREVARDCRNTGRRLLFFSTASTGMYGAVAGPAREDQAVSPGNPYGAHKLALEEQLHDSGADFLVLRLSHLVGRGQPAHQLLPALVQQLGEGVVRVDRRATRDLIDVLDVVTIIDRLLALELHGETVNVASGASVAVERIVEHLERRLALASRREYRDAGAHHVISIDKLTALVPEVAAMGFGPDYYRRVLDAFIGTSAIAAGT